MVIFSPQCEHLIYVTIRLAMEYPRFGSSISAQGNEIWLQNTFTRSFLQGAASSKAHGEAFGAELCCAAGPKTSYCSVKNLLFQHPDKTNGG